LDTLRKKIEQGQVPKESPMRTLVSVRCVGAFLLPILLGALAACAGGSGGSIGPPGPPSLGAQPMGPIRHIVIIIQENRSFNNLFMGFPGANTASSGPTSTGQIVPLTQVNFENGDDLGHFRSDFITSYDNGKMDGFDKVADFMNVPNFAYSYVNKAETQPYWSMASTYGLGDNMFASTTGASFVDHQYIIAGQSDETIDLPLSAPNQVVVPWGCDSPGGAYMQQFNAQGQIVNGPSPCFTYKSMGDELDQYGVSWKFYAPAFTNPADVGVIWSAYDAISDVRYGPDWTSKVSSPETTILTDIANEALPTVSWVTPDFVNSDHPRSRSSTGPQWVASIVNAIGQSQYWQSTAIFVVWDDWGGWYDNVSPPQLDYEGLGFRVPLIVVSPYAKKHYVSHAQHEFGSLLHYIETTQGVPSLGTTDARADDLSDFFDYTQSVSTYTPFATLLSAQHFLSERPSMQAPDNH
jgi:phospholipase C